jgi:hypothetical protein
MFHFFKPIKEILFPVFEFSMLITSLSFIGYIGYVNKINNDIRISSFIENDIKSVKNEGTKV